MGGEKLYEQMEQGAGRGSPPRGRGKASFTGNSRPGVGITPAWAGKSHAVHSPSLGAGDHPRVGGEKWMTPKGEISYIGSPPRGRGKVRILPLTRFGFRITPAWAGKRMVLSASSSLDTDHPRVGGEKILRHLRQRSKKGSPPRGRGKAKKRNRAEETTGITPAWAGKSM